MSTKSGKGKVVETTLLTGQVAKWRFENLKKSLQSELVIFGESSYPAILVPCTVGNDCCYIITGNDAHMDGMIQKLDPEMEKIMVHDDEEIKKNDFLLNVTENTDFRPELLQSIIRLVVLFIKTDRAKPGHSYWLFKDKNRARVYNLSALVKKEDAKLRSKSPYLVPVAALYYHMSNKMCQYKYKHKLGKTDYYRHLIIISECVKLLDYEQQACAAPNLMRSSLYRFSMWCMVEGSLLHNGGNNTISPIELTEKENANGDKVYVKPLRARRVQDVANKLPIGPVLNDYIKKSEKTDKPVVRSRAAPSFAHIPMALDLCFRGLEISCWHFDESKFEEFEMYVRKNPIVMKFIQFARQLCTSLSQQHYLSDELPEAMTYVQIGLLHQEVLEVVELYNVKQLNKQAVMVPDNVITAKLPSSDLFLSLLLTVGGDVQYALAERLQANRDAVQQFQKRFSKFSVSHDRYVRILKHMNPSCGSKYTWVSKVHDNRKRLLSTSGQCFSVALAQHKANFFAAKLSSPSPSPSVNKQQQQPSSNNNNTFKESPMSADIKKLRSNYNALISNQQNGGGDENSSSSSASCKISSSAFTLEPKKVDFLVDTMDPWLYLTSENDLVISLDCDEDFKSTYAVLDKALKAFQSAKSLKKEILIFAKLAMTTRINAQWLKGQNARLFSKKEQDLLQKAVFYYQRGLQVCQNFNTDPHNGGIKEDVLQHDTMKWNLGDTFYQLANRLLNNLQDMHTSREMESQMFDYLTKSIDIWYYFTERLPEASNNLKVARNRIAESHHMLACQHNQAYLEKDTTAKQSNFNMAIEHYQKAAKYFALAVMPTAEFFSRVGILNLLASQFTPSYNASHARITLLDDCFSDVYACSPCLEEIVKNLERVSQSPEAEIQSDENLLYSPTFCQNLHSWFSIFSYIITTIFKHSVQVDSKKQSSSSASNNNNTAATRKLFKDAYDHVLRILQEADLLGVQGGRALSSDISTQLLLKKAHALVKAIKQTPKYGPGSTESKK